MESSWNPDMDFYTWMKRMEAEEEERMRMHKEGIKEEPWLPPDTATCWCITDNPWHCIALKLDIGMREVVDRNIEPCKCSCHPKEEVKPDIGTKPSKLRGARKH